MSDLPPTNQPTNEPQAIASGVKVVSKSAIKTPTTYCGNAYGSTAYGLFKTNLQSEMKRTHAINHVNYGWSQFSKECSQLWKNMTRIERQPYIDLAKETKDSNAPKRPRTSYAFFYKEFKPILQLRNPHLRGQEIAKEIVREWKSLSEVDKIKYHEMNADDCKRYEEEVAEYNKPSNRTRVQQPSSSSSNNSLQVTGTVEKLQVEHIIMSDQIQNSMSIYDGPINVLPKHFTGAYEATLPDI